MWVDAARLPAAEAYQKAHPDVKMDIVTYDGDGNGATTMQTKIQLWNRSGKGWPDVVFSQQVNDPVWMAQKPFEFAAPLEDLISEDVRSQWPATSTAQCTVDGKQYCVQDNLAQVVLWVNQKQMDEFGYTVPTTWQEWAALGEKVATEHPGYIVGNIGDSYSHWIYLWGNQCPLQQLNGDKLTINAADEHCTRDGGPARPADRERHASAAQRVHPGLRPEVRRRRRQGADDARARLVRAGRVRRRAAHPGRGDDRLERPAWERRAGDHRPGRRWPMDHLAALEELRRRGGLRHLGDDRVRPARTARPGYPAYAPAAEVWLAGLAANPYFAADPTPALKTAADQIWQGWSLVTYPDQPVWSDTVVTKLVAGESLSSLLEPFGDALKDAAEAAGYAVVDN